MTQSRHIDLEVYGNDTVVYARASLAMGHRVLVGHGAAPMCMTHRAVRGMGVDAAVGSALRELADKLAPLPARPNRDRRPHSPGRKSSSGDDVRPIPAASPAPTMAVNDPAHRVAG